jgi:hypothetical protein
MKAQNARTSRRTTTMKKTGFAFALLAILLVGSSAALAQKPAAKPAPAVPIPDLGKLDIGKILEQVQTAKIQANAEATSPLQVVAEFLQLRPGQASELGQLLEARQAAIVPLLQTAQSLTQQLGILLNTGGNPVQVGVLVIHLHALQQQIGQSQQSFLSHFVAILDAEQAQKLQAVEIAAQLQPILPAFQPIFLF